jgi:hypothetical protein
MPPELPDRLAYLEPVMAEVRRFKYRLRWWLFGMEDGAALGVVESAVRQRVRGMNSPAARAAVEQDAEALRRWLEQPGGRVGPPGHYVYGAMMGLLTFADFDELTQEHTHEPGG